MVILIGPGGTEGLGYDKGLEEINSLGLKLLEAEFTHGVNISNQRALEIGAKAKELDITITIHAPYYVNLAAKEKEKREASKKRILDSIERAIHLRAKYVVFHPGFYMGRDKKEVYDIIKEELIDLINIIEKKGWDKKILAPETTGKVTQFGDLDELLQLHKELGISITVDFSHIYARNLGVIDYEAVFNKLPKQFHAHFSGIEFTNKGERNHILTTKEFYIPFLEQLKKHKDYDITIINESPKPFDDAKMMHSLLYD